MAEKSRVNDVTARLGPEVLADALELVLAAVLELDPELALDDELELDDPQADAPSAAVTARAARAVLLVGSGKVTLLLGAATRRESAGQ